MNFSPWFVYENFITSTKNIKNSYLLVKYNYYSLDKQKNKTILRNVFCHNYSVYPGISN